ncbi:class I SAM-dependent methyltransferase [Ruegeria atlantica]|uniref:Bifunctional 3-demethylubiquinone-9 3-methyltransferase/ 2-octaprenyl-6-hydroxy phenol methylase n=1 Tax=Ruegeria atlantica TaxID=81569 RepID=A0A0N7LR90_9RHOB|nr:class I SAM-dependent methyltransferase [Ruegeria atlantica]CUH50156.1 bifunctional 3-demethylubiquinone-9 3-methyltransferase/ 2-octaprenyl-6-hydroxy phenol methylase [Ruegeria atlantica]
MRLLGYFDAYLGFLSIGSVDDLGRNGLDVGCGTGAFAEARAVIQPEGKVTLLEPSGKMLNQAEGALALRGVTTHTARSRLEDFPPAQPFDCVLAAHVLEHCHNPTDALRHMRRQAAPAAKLWLVVSKPHWCTRLSGFSGVTGRTERNRWPRCLRKRGGCWRPSTVFQLARPRAHRAAIWRAPYKHQSGVGTWIDQF